MKPLNFIGVFGILFILSLFQLNANETNWKFDDAHTKIEFSVKHMVISDVTGIFKIFDGKVTTTSDDFNNSQIEFEIDVSSINTDNKDRDAHLKTDDFFNAEKYPKMTFKSKSFKKIKGDKYKLVGYLTIRDITKEITLDVIYNGTIKDPYGNTRAGFKLTGSLNRFDYGLKWNKAIETGGLIVGKTINITCNVEIVKQS